MNRININQWNMNEKVKFMNTEGKQIILSYDFIEWFRGFTDAEGCFLIVKTNDTFAFRFIIKLHIDDKFVLDLIKHTLGIGKVSTYKYLSIFSITSQREIEFILKLFTQYSLNTTKHLNFLDLKKAFEIYTASDNKRSLVSKIDDIKNNMNNKRTVFDMPKTYKIYITSYWLLGFIEGDGSFNIEKKNLNLILSIAQKNNFILMQEIKNFFINLVKSKSSLNIDSFVYITKTKIRNNNMIFNLVIKNNDIIGKILIPFFDAKIFHSRMKLNYLDWKMVFKIKELGLHYTEEGKDLINFILSRMNNNRLSSSIPIKTKRSFTLLEIENILNKGSNYKVLKDGRILVKSSGKYSFSRKSIKVELVNIHGLSFKVFNSITSCAKFLGISSHTVVKRIKTNKLILINNNQYYIKILK